MVNFRRVRQMLRKEFIQLRRDPRMRAVIVAVPILQTIIFGYAVTTDVRNVPMALQDRDNSVMSRQLVDRFTGSNYFRVVTSADTDAQAQELIDRSQVMAVLRIPHGFERDLLSGNRGQVQMIVDGSDSNTAGIILGYSGRIVNGFNEKLVVERLDRAGAPSIPIPPIRLVTRAWFNENLESRNFFVPGVIAILVMLITLLLASMAVVREKEIGTIEQIIVTPITQLEFTLGKTIPFILIAFFDVFVITAVAVFWFHIPIRGNFLLLLASTALFLMTTVGVGLLISTVSSTQQQAMMTTFFYFFPAILLSGFIYPIKNMPVVIQWTTYLNPLRFFLVIVRGVFLKGVGPSVLWPQMLALFILGVATLALAASRFRKTLA